MSKIVYSYYCLDILHTGHILMMKQSKNIAGDKGVLIAGILSDMAIMEKKSKPILSLDERVEIAKSIKFVDKVVIQDEYSPLKNIRNINPDILMESSSHSMSDIKKSENFMRSIKGKVVIIPYYEGQSSSRIKELIKNQERDVSK